MSSTWLTSVAGTILALFSGGGLCREHRQSGGPWPEPLKRIAHKHTGFLIQPEQYHIVGSHLFGHTQRNGVATLSRREVLYRLGARRTVCWPTSLSAGRAGSIGKRQARTVVGGNPPFHHQGEASGE